MSLPVSWKKLGNSIISEGIIWEEYQTGKETISLISSTKPYAVVSANNHTKTNTYSSKIGKKVLGKRFRSKESAIQTTSIYLKESKVQMYVDLEA